MAQATQLGAGDLVYADLVGLEYERNLHAGDNVLLDAQLANEEIMDYVARVHNQPDGLAHGDLERPAGNVVLGRGLFVIDADWIAGRIVDVLELRVAELPVG